MRIEKIDIAKTIDDYKQETADFPGKKRALSLFHRYAHSMSHPEFELIFRARFDDTKEAIAAVFGQWGANHHWDHKYKGNVELRFGQANQADAYEPIRSDQISGDQLKAILERIQSSGLEQGTINVQVRPEDRLKFCEGGTFLEDELFRACQKRKALYYCTSPRSEANQDLEEASVLRSLSEKEYLIRAIQHAFNQEPGLMPYPLADAIYLNKNFELQSIYDQRQSEELRSELDTTSINIDDILVVVCWWKSQSDSGYDLGIECHPVIAHLALRVKNVPQKLTTENEITASNALTTGNKDEKKELITIKKVEVPGFRAKPKIAIFHLGEIIGDNHKKQSIIFGMNSPAAIPRETLRFQILKVIAKSPKTLPQITGPYRKGF